MSVRWTSIGTDAVALVDASTGGETVALGRMATGRKVIVRRMDSSTAYTATVTMPSGYTLDGITNGTATVGADAEKSFIALDTGYESIGTPSAQELAGTYAQQGQPFRIPRLAPSQVVTTFQTGHGWTVNGTGSPVGADDTSDFVRGTQCFAVTSAGNAATVNCKKTGLTNMDLTGKTIRLVLRVTNVARLAAISLYVGSGGLANYFILTAASTTTLYEGQWFTLDVPWYNPTSSGSPSRATITDLDVVFSDNGTGPVTVQVNEVSIITEPSVFPNGVVSFTFDDSYNRQYTLGRTCFDKYGLAATAYVIAEECDGGTHRNGTPSMTQTQLSRLQDAGWDIAGHAYTTAAHDNRLTSLTPTALDTELGKLRRWLDTNGYRGGSHYAYPGGVWTADVEDVLLRYFATGRVTDTIPRQFPWPNPRGRVTVYNIASTTTLAQIQTEVDRAYTYKTWLIFVLHDVVSSGASGNTQANVATLQTFVDYCVTKGIPVRTVGEVARMLPWS